MEEFHYAKVSIKHQHVGMYLSLLLDNPSNKKFEINIIGAFFMLVKTLGTIKNQTGWTLCLSRTGNN